MKKRKSAAAFPDFKIQIGDENMGLKLLIVDDNQMQIDSLCAFVHFGQYGINEIQTAANGVMCLEIAEWFQPHIVITDIEMPEMDGLELIRKLKKNGSKAKMIIITCHQKFDYAKTAMEYGVSRFLLKPLDPGEVSAAIANITSEIVSENKMNLVFRESLQQYGLHFEEKESVYVGENMFSVGEMKEKVAEVLQGKASAREALAEYIDFKDKKYICSVILNILKTLLEERGISLYQLIEGNDEFRAFASSERAASPENNIPEFVEAVASAANTEERKNGKYNQISRDIKRYIDENYSTIDSVEQIADHLEISSSYAKRVFQKTDGKTVFDYLLQTRIDVAKKLLKDPYCKVYEIADRVGYKSTAYFAETFRKHVGCTPSEYREREICRQ